MSSFSINTNLNALKAQRHLSRANKDTESRLNRLASALRINRAADDPAGLAVSEKLRTRIRGDSQALKNLQDGLSMVQTAEGGSRQVQSHLQRIRELSLRAANDTLSNQDRQSVQAEIDQLKEEINRLTDTVEFNGKKLLNGDLSASSGGADIHAGPQAGDRIKVQVGAQDTASLGVDSVDVTTQDGAETAVEATTGAINQVSTEVADLGAQQNRLEESVEFVRIQKENQEASESRIRDADLARETTELAQSEIRRQAGTSTLSQAQNLNGQVALQLLN